jgi:DNA repair protein RadC
MMDKQSIKFWKDDDKPREKALSKGVQALSDVELLAVLIGKGTMEANAVEVARNLFQSCGNSFNTLASRELRELCNVVKGIGPAKAVTIAVALEIARRRQSETIKEVHIRTPEDAVQILQPLMQDSNVELAYAIYLRSNKVLAVERISNGGLSATVVDHRLIFKSALLHNATTFILAHNHPSGTCSPSEQDVNLTKKIIEASTVMDIKCMDHVIIGSTGKWYSFAQESTLSFTK